MFPHDNAGSRGMVHEMVWRVKIKYENTTDRRKQSRCSRLVNKLQS